MRGVELGWLNFIFFEENTMAMDAIKVLLQDEDSQYEKEERDAMKAVEMSDLQNSSCDLLNVLENGLVNDIKEKNTDYLMRPEMWALFATTVLPGACPKQDGAESDSFFRIRAMKYLLKNALKDTTLPDWISKDQIDVTSSDLTANDVLALHYFQLLRHIPGKSKPDAICGPLTMKDLLAANGVQLSEKLGDKFDKTKDRVFVEYNGTTKKLDFAEIASLGIWVTYEWVDPKQVSEVYQVNGKYVVKDTNGDVCEIWKKGDQLSSNSTSEVADKNTAQDTTDKNL